MLKIVKHKEISGLDVALYLLLFFVCIMGISTLALIVRMPIIGFYIIIGFAIVAISAFVFYEKIKALKLVLILLFVIVGSTLFASSFYDISFDGNSYRKPSVYMLNMGWNPVYETFREASTRFSDPLPFTPGQWFDTYPKGDYLVAAPMYSLVGNVEAGSFFNPLLLIALIGVTYTILKDLFNLSKLQTAMCVFVLAINPVSLAQLTNFYNDVALGNMVFIFILACMYILMKRDGAYVARCWALIFLTPAIGFNLKLSGPVFFAIFMVPFYFYLMYVCFKASNIASMRRITVFFTVCVISAFCFFGMTTYVTNTIRFHNPVFGTIGEGSFDIVTPQIPTAIRDEPLWSQFAHSIFVEKGQDGTGILKTPFTITTNDRNFMFAFQPDIRLSGWGVFFSGIFLISALIINIYLIRTNRRSIEYWIAASLVVLIFLPVPFVPGLFWARYYPQLFILPVIALVILFRYCDANNSFKRRVAFSQVLSVALSALIIANATPQIITLNTRLQLSNDIRRSFEQIVEESQGLSVRIGSGGDRVFGGVIVNMIDMGITNYIIDNDLQEFDGIVTFGFWRIGYTFEE